MACVAKRSTTVRKAMSPMTRLRRAAPYWRGTGCGEARISLSMVMADSGQGGASAAPARHNFAGLIRVFGGREQRGDAPDDRRLDAEHAHQDMQALRRCLGEGEGQLERKVEIGRIVIDRNGDRLVELGLDMPNTCLLEE